jgi:hypothetical protein
MKSEKPLACNSTDFYIRASSVQYNVFFSFLSAAFQTNIHQILTLFSY